MAAPVHGTSPSNVSHVAPQPRPARAGATVSAGGPKAPKADEGSSRVSEEKLSKEYEDTYNTVYDQAIAAGATPKQAHAQAKAAAEKHVNKLLEKVENKKDLQTLKQTLPEIREQVIYNKQLEKNGGLIYEAATFTASVTKPTLLGLPSVPATVNILKKQAFSDITLAEAKALIAHFKNEKTLTPEQKSKLKALKVFVEHENRAAAEKLAGKVDRWLHSATEVGGSIIVGILGGTFTSNGKTSKDFYTEDKIHNKKEKSEEDNSPRKITGLELGVGLAPGQKPGQQTQQS